MMEAKMWRSVLLIACAIWLVNAKSTSRVKRDLPTISSSGNYKKAAIAADNLVCSEVGRSILEDSHGSTADAAIATVFCSSVMNSHTMGLGGGFLGMVKHKKEIWALNAREVAPLAATQDMFVNNPGASSLGGLAIAVPGELAGYRAIHKRYGKLDFADLVAPAQAMAAAGVPVTASLAAALVSRSADVFREDGLREVYTKNGETELLIEGDTLILPKYAATLQRIMDEGPESFYTGALADDIIADIDDCGGIITHEDLASYVAEWKQPVCITLNNAGIKLCGPPPPSSAAIINFILNIMDNYNYGSGDLDLDDKILLIHRMVEAMRFGFGKRSALGDAEFVNNCAVMEDLLSHDFATETWAKINDSFTQPFEYYESSFILGEDHGTSHLSILEDDGLALTSTINFFLGSKCMGSRTGILFNNEMDDFSTPGQINNFGISPSPTNFIVPRKHPMSSMSPMYLTYNDNTLALGGSSGGTRIISGLATTIMNSFIREQDIREAVDEMRFHNQLLPNDILHEPSWDQDIIDGLAAKGHTFKIRSKEFSVQQWITDECQKDSGNNHPDCYTAVSDKRRGGAPDGF